jgi:uncharacterized protein
VELRPVKELFAPFRSSLPWLAERTIYLTRHGSQAYGTSLPSSDLDVKGVAIAPAPYYLGFLQRFEQAESHEPDVVIFELRKLMSLAAECNPSLIEVLWTDEEDHLLVTPAGRELLDARAAFLSRKARHTFAGYALSQLKRIATHHRWLTLPPQAPPTRAEHGLPERTLLPKEQLLAAESAIHRKLDEWEVDLEPLDEAGKISFRAKVARLFAELSLASDETRHRAAGRTLGYDDNFLLLLDRERAYRARQREWEQFQSWQKNRNPARAALEAKFGYDTKHALHLVRLMRMCREILSLGKVIVKRPDREELLAIRAGAWSYDQLVSWAQSEDEALGELARTSPLPHAPDRPALDALCVRLVERALVVV